MPKMTILALFGPNINFIKKGPTNCAISQKREFLQKKGRRQFRAIMVPQLFGEFGGKVGARF